MGALRFDGVVKSFGPNRVLDGFTADLDTRGVTFVVGKSGSGKSVLCRLATGLLRPDAGAVTLFGEKVHALPERALLSLRRRAPYIVQGPALIDWLTVEENVALAAKTVGAGKEEISRALERVGLLSWADRRPAALSPGAKKRAAIARALVLSPELLLLDEPTTGLDRDAAAQVNEVIASLAAAGLGALVVSHDYRALERLADRVVVVAGKRCAFSGGRDEFFRSGEPAVRELLRFASPAFSTR